MNPILAPNSHVSSLLRSGVLALAAGSLVQLAGCAAGHGEHTSKAAQEGALKMSSVKSGVEYQIAHEQFMNGMLDKASRTIDGAIALNPKVAKSHVLRGRIMIERGELESARASLLQAEDLDASCVEAQYYLGIVHERFSQPEEALVRYTKAVALDPANAQYVVAAAEMMVQAKRYSDAETLIAMRSDSLANNAAVRQTAGHIALLQNQYDKAAELFSQARLLAPDDPSVVEDLVRAQMAAKRYADAEFNISVLMRDKANADRRDLKHWRAECLVALERLTDARAILDQLTAGDAGQADVQAWLAQGRVAAALGDQNRLRIAAQRVIALAPKRSDGYLMRALHLRAAGEFTGALAATDAAISVDEDAATPRLLRALILKDLGRDEEASKAVSQVLEISPFHATARRFQVMLDNPVEVANAAE